MCHIHCLFSLFVCWSKCPEHNGISVALCSVLWLSWSLTAQFSISAQSTYVTNIFKTKIFDKKCLSKSFHSLGRNKATENILTRVRLSYSLDRRLLRDDTRSQASTKISLKCGQSVCIIHGSWWNLIFQQIKLIINISVQYSAVCAFKANYFQSNSSFESPDTALIQVHLQSLTSVYNRFQYNSPAWKPLHMMTLNWSLKRGKTSSATTKHWI